MSNRAKSNGQNRHRHPAKQPDNVHPIVAAAQGWIDSVAERLAVNPGDVIVLRGERFEAEAVQQALAGLSMQTGAAVMVLPEGHTIETASAEAMLAAGWVPATPGPNDALTGVPTPMAHTVPPSVQDAAASPPASPMPPEAR